MHHDLLPSQQHPHPGLPALSEAVLHRRRERVFLILAGLFLGTLAMLNILGITRFLVLGSWDPDAGFALGRAGTYTFAVAVGVLPYPLTFLCTDFISELYGRRRANQVVWVGLMLNVWVVFILWAGGAWPGFEGVAPGVQNEVNAALGALPATGAPPEVASQDAVAAAELIRHAVAREPVFFEVRALAFGAVTASMVAYLVAQFVDVQVFHFWKWLTKGKHLWLRNNGSTLISQLVDTVAVILITYYYAHALPVDKASAVWPQLMTYIATGYVFKAIAALLDTIPFYVVTPAMVRYLRLPPPTYQDPVSGRAAVEGGVG